MNLHEIKEDYLESLKEYCRLSFPTDWQWKVENGGLWFTYGGPWRRMSDTEKEQYRPNVEKWKKTGKMI